MTRYSVQPRDQIFIKGYGYLCFAKNMSKNIGKYISKNLSSKYGQKLLYHAKQSATDTIKTSSKKKSHSKKTAEATGDLIGNKIANKITKVSKDLQQKDLETVANEHGKEIPKKRYVSPEESQEISDELRLKQYGNEISKNHNKIIQRQLQMRMIKKDIYLQKKDKKLLTI